MVLLILHFFTLFFNTLSDKVVAKIDEVVLCMNINW